MFLQQSVKPPPNSTKRHRLNYRIQSTARKTPRGVKDYEEEDWGSGTEADNEEKEEEGDYDSEYDQEDKGKIYFFDNDDDDGPMYMEINPKLQQQVERLLSRTGCENGKRRRIEEPTEQPDLDIIRNSVSPPRIRTTPRLIGISHHTTTVAQPNNYGQYCGGKLWEEYRDRTCNWGDTGRYEDNEEKNGWNWRRTTEN